MNSSPIFEEVQLSHLTTIDLDPEHFESAIATSQTLNSEASPWKTYIQALGQISFIRWLKTRLGKPSNLKASSTPFAPCQVGPFKIALITTEQVYDGLADLPQSLIEENDQAAHFYVLLQILEEQATVIMRGFVRHDQLKSDAIQTQMQSSDDGYYQVPLVCFESEASFLLASINHLDPAVILPASIKTEQPQEASIVSSLTNLRNSLYDAWDEGWQTLESLFGPAYNVAYSPRSLSTKRGKRLDFGLQFGEQSVVLLLTVNNADNDEIGVQIQLLPAPGVERLPANITLSMLTETGDILQSIQARERDNLIQLQDFTGEKGDRFSISVGLENQSHTEDFEL